MRLDLQNSENYIRYHIETSSTPDIVDWPNPFLVKVNRLQLAKLLIQEVFHQRGDVKAITSRPCIYGTFSGPIGGFAPRPQHCVGCLRCTIQHPETVSILHNPARQVLGDSYFSVGYINAVAYEAATGNIPVKGAGYRGKFGGEGWDGMWTDMSEIVRPTRDGIHGREFISTVVDIGEKPAYLVFDKNKQPIGMVPRTFSIPIPFIFDLPPASVISENISKILAQAAVEIQSLAILPISMIMKTGLNQFIQSGSDGTRQEIIPENEQDAAAFRNAGKSVVPLVYPEEVAQLADLSFSPVMVELNAVDLTISSLESTILKLKTLLPDTIIVLRHPFVSWKPLKQYYDAGIRVFHLIANYHGRDLDGHFVLDLIRTTHLAFVEAGIRDDITLIGSGGIVASEHVPKAIICGLDLVALDTPLMVAMQGDFIGECVNRAEAAFSLPDPLNPEWSVQRIKNMTAAWRDQLLEILGAMGLREVRRLRGEVGRAMFQVDLEREAFAEIDGYHE